MVNDDHHDGSIWTTARDRRRRPTAPHRRSRALRRALLVASLAMAAATLPLTASGASPDPVTPEVPTETTPSVPDTGSDPSTTTEPETPAPTTTTAPPAPTTTAPVPLDGPPAPPAPPVAGKGPTVAAAPVAAAASNLNTWGCPPDGLLFQYPPPQTDTSMRRVDMASGDYTTPASIANRGVNAIGYNTLDDYVYGYDTDNSKIIRVGPGGGVEVINVPAGVVTTGGFVIGDVDNNGHYWILRGTEWFQINLATMVMVSKGVAAPPAGVTVGFDWAFVPGTNKLYAIGVASGTAGVLLSFDRTTKQFKNEGPLGNTGGPGSNQGSGAVFADPNGFLYASYNTTGQIWRVDIAAKTAVFFSQGPASSANDGARCANAPVPIDFGDAPSSYGTLLADNGPRHALPSFNNTASTAPLRLGAVVDIDTDGRPSPLADGDDLHNRDDEDGVTPVPVVIGQPTVVPVTAVNSTTSPVTLAGWIDLDGNGTFDAAERQTVTVPANSGSAVYNLTFPASYATGAATYARFRLFDQVLANPSPLGNAKAGEVEDYRFLRQNFSVNKVASVPSTTPGGTVTYTVTITNTGGVAYTAADPAVVNDDLTAVLDDADFGSVTVAPVGAGAAARTGNTLNWTGPLAAGATVTLTYDVTVRDRTALGDSNVRNAITGGTCPTPAVTNPARPDFVPACVVHTPVGMHTVTKTTNRPDGTDVFPNEIVTYTITVKNTGRTAITETVTDDLSGVLDDAAYRNDAAATSGTAAVDVGTKQLTWTGTLPVGGTATITYSVKVNAAGALGDGVLGNVVTSTGSSNCPAPAITDPAAPGYDPTCSTTHDVPAVQYRKVVSTPDVAELQPGDTFTYVVTATNVGGRDLTGLSFTDDLSDVLDDATVVGGFSATAGTALLTGTTLTWTGDLAVGATATVTYTVQIDNPIGGNAKLVNAVVSTDPGSNCVPGGTDPRCHTTVPQPLLTTTKTLVSPANPQPGDLVTYAVTVRNDGSGPATGIKIVDDLSDVIDDGELKTMGYTGSLGSTAWDSPVLTWTITSLGSGATTTLTYRVKLHPADQLGDGILDNAVTGAGCPRPAITDPDDPAYQANCHLVVPVAGYTLTKTSDPATGGVAPGQTVTYTVKVRNTGGVALTPTVVDDLADVLDDATFGTATASAGPAPVQTGTTLTWTGPLAVGSTVTLTYTVTVPSPVIPTGNGVLANVVTGDGPTPCRPPVVLDPADPDYVAGCAPAPLPILGYTIEKVADTATVLPGGIVTYTVRVTNTGNSDFTAANPITFTDDLSAVLDDATYNNDAVSDPASADLDYQGGVVSWSSPLPKGGVATITYSVTVKNPVTGDLRLKNAVVTPGGPCPAGSVDPRCSTEVTVPNLQVRKTPSTTNARPGDVVTYTLVVTNTGTAAFPAATPATVTDDLAAVLDDAFYNNDVAATVGTATITGGVLSWSDPLAAGAAATITYSVTVDRVPRAGANQRLVNKVTSNVGNCVAGTTDPTCSATTTVPQLDVAKAADVTAAGPGSVVTYTVTIKNTGTGDFTVANPASVTDDLTGVLDDAISNGDAAVTPVVGDLDPTPTALTWTGPLAAGATVTLTYSVTVKGSITESGGNAVLDNRLTTPFGNCVVGSVDPDCSTSTPVRELIVAKTSDKANALPGETVTYTVTVTNAGKAAYIAADPASFTDDLSGVIDDATYNDDAAAAPNVGTITETGNVLGWSGPLAAGATVTVTYSVTLPLDPQGDHVLRNAVVTPTGPCEPGSDDPRCSTQVLVPDLDVVKTASAASALPGQAVTYTVTVTNNGPGAFTAAAPAVVTDDLAGVLDDAVYNGDVAATVGTATVVDGVLSWSAPLAAGATSTITYSVTVDAVARPGGNATLANRVTSNVGNCAVGTTDPDCSTTTTVPTLDVAKTVNVTSAGPGGVVAYTVTITNTGTGDFTAAVPAVVTDDLTGVLDDAVSNEDAKVSPVVGTVDEQPTAIVWTGPLAAGQTVTLTYSVTVNALVTEAGGNAELANTVTAPFGNCVVGSVDPDCSTATPVRELIVAKTSDKANALPGETVTYTVTATNAGKAAYTAASPASFTDDLSGVLDDATYNDDATAAPNVGDLTRTGNVLGWSGPLAAGATVTVTYSVTLPLDPKGNHQLKNAVVTPTGPCVTGSTDPRCSAITLVPDLRVAKRADVTEPVAGQPITYTIDITNDGPGAFTAAAPAVVTDDLADVLDDAVYNGDVTATVGTVAIVDGVLTWSEPLAAGATATITYSVTLDQVARPGADATLKNRVVTNVGNCIAGSTDPDCAVTTETPRLAVEKTVDDTTALPGGVVRYSVTLRNTGTAPFTTATPASFTDDLTGVLDDADYLSDVAVAPTVGTVDDAANVISWRGPLAAGAAVTVTYSVRVHATVTGGPGDAVLVNRVTTPFGNCTEESEDPACGTSTALPELQVHKAASSDQAEAGDTVTYTVTLRNSGPGAFTADRPATVTDDLTAVLDDATYQGDATADDGSDVTFTSPELTWSGPIAPGAEVVLTYSVVVNDPITGDQSLGNVVTTNTGTCVEGSDDPACATVTKVASLAIAKSVDVESAEPGDVVTYTVTVTNTGDVAYGDDNPARFDDDLSAVLDDATYNDDAAASAGPAPTVLDGVLSWGGPLAPGEVVTVIYSVTVDDPADGDLALVNVVTSPNPGTNCPVGSEDPGCGTVTPLGHLDIVKTVDVDEVRLDGLVGYTVTITNTGQADYPADRPATVVDDLDGVLDDATWVGNATASQGTVTYADATLTWTGPIAVGETVTLRYGVRVNTTVTGDGALENTVGTRGGNSNCGPGTANPVCATRTTITPPTPAPPAPVPPARPSPITPGPIPVTG